MKILLLTPFWRPIPGGVSKYVSELRDRLVAGGHEVRVVSMAGALEDGVEVSGSRGRYVWRSIDRQLRRERPDVVHVHGHWLLLFPAIWGKLVGRTRRVIFTFHTATRTKGLRKRLFSALLNRCDFVTAVSADLLSREVARLRIRAPVAVTYPGAEASRVSAIEIAKFRNELGVNDKAQLVVTVSPLQYPRKAAGVIDLIRAFGIVSEGDRGPHLVVVGDGQYREHISNLLRELHLKDRIHLIGAMPNATVAIAAADVFCHVSYQDELPLSVLEAMADGKSIICSPIGGIPEALRDRSEGLFVEDGPMSIASALSSVMKDERLRARLGVHARERALRDFTWSQAVERIGVLYGIASTRRIHYSVDVEEDYSADPGSYRGVTEGLPRILQLFRTHGIRGSFFVTEDVARRFPEVVKRIRKEGHYLGTHALSHATPSLAGRSVSDQEMELRGSVSFLGRDLSQPVALRAPNFRIDEKTIQACSLASIQVDSSVVPNRLVRRTGSSPRIDFRGALAEPYRASRVQPQRLGLSSVVEIPVTSNPYAPGSPLGLGFVNVAGPEVSREALGKVPGRTVLFLIHPWEAIDYPQDRHRPKWMTKGCTADLSRFESFLMSAAMEHQAVPFPDLLRDILTPNFRWWSPGPWAETVPRPKLLIVTNVFRPITGGVTTYLNELKGNLAALGFDVTLMAYPSALVRREASRHNLRLRKVTHFAFAVACALRVLGWRLRGHEVLVHSHGASFCLAAAYLSRWLGAVGIHTFHSPPNHRSLLLQWFAPRLDALAYVSESTQQLYERANQAYHDRVAIVPGGVSFAPDGAQDDGPDPVFTRRRLGISSEEFLALFVGRLVPEKGAHVLVEAMSAVREAIPSVRLLLVGPRGTSTEHSQYHEELRDEIQKRGLSEVVRLLGEIPEDELRAAYRAADCLVVPSLWAEPAPMVVAEAMREGLPVIASKIGGLPSRIIDGATGLLFTPGDPRDLARCITFFARDPQVRSNFARAARSWIREHASAPALARFHVQMYQGLWREARKP